MILDAQGIPGIIDILLAPATLLIIGRFIINTQSKHESRQQAVEQVLNGYGEQEGLIERVNRLEQSIELLKLRKH